MTEPTPVLDSQELPSDDFLATTEIDKDGNLTSRRIKLQDVSSELLFQIGANGNKRAMDELASRLIKDHSEKTP